MLKLFLDIGIVEPDGLDHESITLVSLTKYYYNNHNEILHTEVKASFSSRGKGNSKMSYQTQYDETVLGSYNVVIKQKTSLWLKSCVAYLFQSIMKSLSKHNWEYKSNIHDVVTMLGVLVAVETGPGHRASIFLFVCFIRSWMLIGWVL